MKLRYHAGDIVTESGEVIAKVVAVSASRKLKDRLGKLAVNQFNNEEHGKFLAARSR